MMTKPANMCILTSLKIDAHYTPLHWLKTTAVGLFNYIKKLTLTLEAEIYDFLRVVGENKWN